jgi:methionyl-tRNA formyltransferase
MAATSLRLGFAGTPEFALPALNALARSRHRVAAVYTQPDRPAGRGQALHLSAVKRRALELGLAVRQPATLKTPEALQGLAALELDALVVVAYGLILPPPVLAVPRLGCFNIHGSLLPRWRGAAPVQRALLAGDEVSGVTIMRMAEGLDTGPMLSARAVPIGERDTAGMLHDRLAQLGADLIVEALDAVAAGRATEVSQPDAGVTYAHKISKAEALIDWREAAQGIVRRVRAFNPWPIAETRFNGTQLRIWDAELAGADAPADGPANAPADAPADGPVLPPGTVIAAGSAGRGPPETSVDVVCGQGVLRLLTLQLAGRKPLPAREFLKAQQLAGAVLG